jgi:hypothetical protein
MQLQSTLSHFLILQIYCKYESTAEVRTEKGLRICSCALSKFVFRNFQLNLDAEPFETQNYLPKKSRILNPNKVYNVSGFGTRSAFNNIIGPVSGSAEANHFEQRIQI